jgi:hypothetical protein
MKVESLNFYLENLLPGIAILISILVLLPFPNASVQSNFMVAALMKSDIILSVGFLSVSYLLGVVSAVISRFCIDWLSERFPRPWILRRLSHKTYAQLKASLVSLPSLDGQNWRRAWNEAYRASLRYVISNGMEKAATEIWRRREQGRLIRNLFFPLVLGSAALTKWLQIRNGWIIAAIVFIISVFSIFFYSYAEYTTFAEAILHLPEADAQKSGKEKGIRKWNFTRMFPILGQLRGQQKRENDLVEHKE